MVSGVKIIIILLLKLGNLILSPCHLQDTNTDRHKLSLGPLCELTKSFIQIVILFCRHVCSTPDLSQVTLATF